MKDKKNGLKRLFSKSNKDCCSVEIEEVNPEEGCNGEASKENTEQQSKDV